MTTDEPLADRIWKVRSGWLPLDRPLIMGILNITPDSFSDGGLYEDPGAAIDAGVDMWEAGSGIIDVGGESTRPGAEPVPLEVELDRVIPVVSGLSERGIRVSIDTTKPAIARAAIEAGAVVVNDVTGLRDPTMRELCARTDVGVVIMHMLGSPRTMQDNPVYDDVVIDVANFLGRHARLATEAGVRAEAIVVDPGIGFGKAYDHNIALLNAIGTIAELGYPVLVGASRKRFLGQILEPIRGSTVPSERDAATLGVVALAVASGASILRVHDVVSAVEVATTVNAIVRHDGRDELT